MADKVGGEFTWDSQARSSNISVQDSLWMMGFSMNAAIKDSFENRRSPAADRDPSGGKVRQIPFDFQ